MPEPLTPEELDRLDAAYAASPAAVEVLEGGTMRDVIIHAGEFYNAFPSLSAALRAAWAENDRLIAKIQAVREAIREPFLVHDSPNAGQITDIQFR